MLNTKKALTIPVSFTKLMTLASNAMIKPSFVHNHKKRASSHLNGGPMSPLSLQDLVPTFNRDRDKL